eukprot:3024351-Pleurochrysis_carterae.AAC.1
MKIQLLGGWELARALGWARLRGGSGKVARQGSSGNHEQVILELEEQSASAPRVRMRCDAKTGNHACECQTTNERCA